MLEAPSRLLRLIKLAAGLVLLVVLAGPYLRDGPSVAQVREQVLEQYAEVLRSFQDEKKLFVADFLGGGVALEGTGLAALCASRTWFPDDKAVIVSCEPSSGGPGAVKNGLLSCIRFAIEVGAQLVLPRMFTRHPTDLINLSGGGGQQQRSKGAGLDYMFNTAHLVGALAAHCPQLRVHASLDALYDRPTLARPLSVTLSQLIAADPDPDGLPATFALDGIPTTILADPSVLRARLLAQMDRDLAGGPAAAAAASQHPIRWPVRVHLAASQFAFPAFTDGAVFRRDFGRLLRVRDDARALAASALWNLAARHNASCLPPPSSSSTGGSASGSDAAAAEGFLAVHLRTEKDAMASGYFPGYDDQTAYFFNYLASLAPAPAPPGSGAGAGGDRPPVIVYLATGLTAADDDVRRFRERAAELNATVLLKRDLLDDGELAVLDHLTWDQRALVDHEVLLRAGRVLGTVESFFAWDVTLQRAELYGRGGGTGFTLKPGGESHPQLGTADKEVMKMWEDQYSSLYGSADRAVSVFLGTWP